MLIDMSPLTVRFTVSEILDRRGMSTAEFAKKANLTYGQALAIRRGAYARLDLNVLGRICAALGVQPGDLFETENTETN